MKILFITSTRIGDGVLSTGALGYLIRKYSDAEITVACGSLISGIFEQAPNVVRVISIKKEPYAMHWRKLWIETVGTKWDIVIDLRNSLMSRLLRAKKRYIWGKQDKKKHKVEQIADVIEASPTPSPVLWFDDGIRQKAEVLIPTGLPVLAIGPTANWPAKTWSAENFIDLIGRLTSSESIFPLARVAIFAASGEEEIAYKVLNAIPEDRRIDVISKTSPVVAAAALQRCCFYVGNDSGLMHCAAAAGVPTLGLFGPGWPRMYRPWGEHCAFVSTPENFDQLTNYPKYSPRTAPCLMKSLTVTAACTAAVDLWEKVSVSSRSETKQ
ncbi:MAG: glycosyltransferase family 9 protein [Alphaproteobacteria bacterium]|nr:glycosyltransferase family 9 protein [Alphaproteobacteria bacterium]